MSFSIGIVGLPNVGKSTLFKALTKREVAIAPYPFTTIDPNIGIVPVPDERLKEISKIAPFEKITPTHIKFIDIAGLVKNAFKGEGLGNQFLSHIKECDGILEAINCFRLDEKKLDEGDYKEIKEEITTLENELIMKDLEITENILEKLKPKLKSLEDKELIKKGLLLEKIKETLLKGGKIISLNLIEEEKNLIKEYQFLTLKPVVYIFNIKGEREIKIEEYLPSISIDLKTEAELTELEPKEKKELGFLSKLDQIILYCYNTLNLITFYTIRGLKEAHAWTLRKENNILEAGRKVHSDFEKKFVRAEVINLKELIDAGSYKSAKEMGIVKIVGKDYRVKDGDVIEFKI